MEDEEEESALARVRVASVVCNIVTINKSAAFEINRPARGFFSKSQLPLTMMEAI